MAEKLGGVPIWEAMPTGGGEYEFCEGLLMRLKLTQIALPAGETVPAVGVDITNAEGERRINFAVSTDDLNRALLNAR